MPTQRYDILRDCDVNHHDFRRHPPTVRKLAVRREDDISDRAFVNGERLLHSELCLGAPWGVGEEGDGLVVGTGGKECVLVPGQAVDGASMMSRVLVK